MTPIKDEVISLFPNLPSHNGEYLHKVGIRKLLLGLYQHLEQITYKIPLDAQVLPQLG
jgi:hypothetical protein